MRGFFNQFKWSFRNAGWSQKGTKSVEFFMLALVLAVIFSTASYFMPAGDGGITSGFQVAHAAGGASIGTPNINNPKINDSHLNDPKINESKINESRVGNANVGDPRLSSTQFRNGQYSKTDPSAPCTFTTDYEYRNLSELAYKRNDESFKEITKALGDWEVLEEHDDSKTGFQATVFKNRVTGEIVISFRGTDELKDVITDAGLYAGVPLNQVKSARKFYDSILKQYGPEASKISFTGHSLGGAIAQRMSMETGVPAVTFNAPGLKDHHLSGRTVGVWHPLVPIIDFGWSLFNPNMNLFDDIKNWRGVYDHQITNYVDADDIIGNWGIHAGRTIVVEEGKPWKEIKDYSLSEHFADHPGKMIKDRGGQIAKGFPGHGLHRFDSHFGDNGYIAPRLPCR